MLQSPEVELAELSKDSKLNNVSTEQRCFFKSENGKFTRECILKAFSLDLDQENLSDEEFMSKSAIKTVTEKKDISEAEHDAFQGYGCYRRCYYWHHIRYCYRRCYRGYYGGYRRYGHHWSLDGTCRYKKVYRNWRMRAYKYCFRSYDIEQRNLLEQTSLNTKLASVNCELSANKNKFECIKELSGEAYSSSYTCRRTMRNVFMQASQIRMDYSSSMYRRLANLYSELAKMKSDCGSLQ